MTAVEYNEKCITRFCQTRFITYTFEYGVFAATNGFKKKLQASCEKLKNQYKGGDLFSIINSCENTRFNQYAAVHDKGRRCINVDMEIGHPVYDFVLEILQLQIDLGIADPGTVAVHANGQRGVIFMVKDEDLDDQMPHTDLHSDQKGYISYFDTTHSEWARHAYKPEKGDGGLSCFICFDSLEDFLGNPGGRPHCLGGNGVSIVGGNCLHFGTGNDRGQTKYKLFVHFDSPGFNRATNVKHDKVFVSSLYTVIRESVEPYRLCSRIMLYQYACHGCIFEHPTHFKPYNNHTYPYCNFCLQHRFHVEITCKLKVKKSKKCKACDKIKATTSLCKQCNTKSRHCATYDFKAHYTGNKVLHDGQDLSMKIAGGNVVTKQRYQDLHTDFSGRLINAIQLTEGGLKKGEEPLYLDCTQIKPVIACFRQSGNIDDCNIVPHLVDGVVCLTVQGTISGGCELVVYNRAKESMSKTLLIEYNRFSARSINKKVCDKCKCELLFCDLQLLNTGTTVISSTRC